MNHRPVCGNNSSVEALSSQVTPSCVKLTKTSRHNCVVVSTYAECHTGGIVQQGTFPVWFLCFLCLSVFSTSFQNFTAPFFSFLFFPSFRFVAHCQLIFVMIIRFSPSTLFVRHSFTNVWPWSLCQTLDYTYERLFPRSPIAVLLI